MVEDLEDAPASPPPAPLAAGAPARDQPAPKAAFFWKAGELPADLAPEPAAQETVGSLLARMGPFPFWRGTHPLPDALLPSYEAAAAAALELLAELTPK
jgi:hypothetical protein